MPMLYVVVRNIQKQIWWIPSFHKENRAARWVNRIHLHQTQIVEHKISKAPDTATGIKNPTPSSPKSFDIDRASPTAAFQAFSIRADDRGCDRTTYIIST
jgi:hypothetical protein